jgi:hypothetical protein
MPSFEIFESYARRVEQEMSSSAKKIGIPPKTKRCPICRTECELTAQTCDVCGHEFPSNGHQPFRPCTDCGALNPLSAASCHACGNSFGTSFNLSLDEALRTGAIVRGMELDEDEVRRAEKIAQPVRQRVLRSGDETLVRVFKTLPDESFARLKDILAASE